MNLKLQQGQKELRCLKLVEIGAASAGEEIRAASVRKERGRVITERG
jgi:hypothetical protein